MKENRSGFLFSLLFHLAIIALIVTGGVFYKRNFTVSPPCTIPLEITSISDVSTAPISKPKVLKPKEQERAREETGEEKFIEELVLSEPPVEEKPTVRDPVKEVPSQPKPKPAPVPEKKQTLEDLIKELAPEPEKKSIKKPPKKAEKKVQKGAKNKGRGKEDFIKVLKDFDTHQEEGPSAETPITDVRSKSSYGASRVGPKMAMSITDRVRRLLEGAWLIPQRAQDGRELVVHLHAEMGRDGYPRSVRVIHGRGTPNHPAYAIAVERALQALSKCSPLPLPAEHYAEWKELDIPFRRR